jgi:nicotinamide mononucleotide transporter
MWLVISWVSDNWIEVFGAVTGILFVILEIRQNLLLWPVGIVTSAVYIWVFLTGKLYADMSLQGYYLVISVMGWYWWIKRSGQRVHGSASPFKGLLRPKLRGGEGEVSNQQRSALRVTRITFRMAWILAAVFAVLYISMFLVLSSFTDSPVPAADSFITSLSIIATWMLARKIYEHWYLWIVVNSFSAGLFVFRELYPTMVLYIIYCVMSFAGLRAWKRTI